MSRVVVVGGGIVGCATAYFAAREGLRVTLLEREHVAFGASGRNPGFVWLHCRNRGFALEISLRGRELYPQLLEELPEPFEFRPNGGLVYFNTPEQGRVFEEFVAARRVDGLDVELVDGADVRRLVPPIRADVEGGSFCSRDAQINTAQFVRALAAGARAEGAEVREGVLVDGLLRSGEEVVGVATAAGPIEADSVVLAAGAWSAPLLADLGIELAVGAERLQVVSTHPLPLEIQPVVYGPPAVKQYTLFRDLPSWDPSLFTAPYESERGIEMLELIAQRATGEILMGCPMDYPGRVDLRPTLAGILATARFVWDDFPGLRDAPIDRAWSGSLPYTSDTLPVIDEVAPGLLVAAGHVFGNAAGPMTGRLVADLLLGREPEIDLDECRLDRPLGPVDTGEPARW